MRDKKTVRGPQDSAVSLWNRAAQRRQIHQELACLAVFVSELKYQEETGMGLETRERRSQELLCRMLGSMEGPGELQRRLNSSMNNILVRLTEDYPKLSWQEVLVFSYTVAGLPNELIRHMAQLSCNNAVSVMKSRLRSMITYSRSQNKEEYLSLLHTKSCRIGEEMLYLHNL